MAVTASWKTVQSFFWLLFAAVCLFLSIVLWAINFKQPDVVEIEPEKKAQEAVRPVKTETVAFDPYLGTFEQEVPVLVLQQRAIAVGDRAPEFRGSKFISEKNKQWSLQLMSVTEEDIIKSYLDKRNDRSKFQYFRLQAEGQAENFVLTYGIFKDVNEVLEKTKSIKFDLPSQIKTKPEKFSTYASSVNDLGYDELSSGLKLKSITLTKAPLPILIVRPATSAASDITTQLSATTTTRQTDKNTQQQKVQTDSLRAPTHQSSVQEQKSTPSRPQQNESQVIDPF